MTNIPFFLHISSILLISGLDMAVDVGLLGLQIAKRSISEFNSLSKASISILKSFSLQPII